VGITTYAPNLNLVRDPRWGRAQEVYGEDPWLTSRLTVAYVQGQQGVNETETKYMLAGSCCKHWAAYGQQQQTSHFPSR
jgi:beta-glucosidase